MLEKHTIIFSIIFHQNICFLEYYKGCLIFKLVGPQILGMWEVDENDNFDKVFEKLKILKNK